MASMPTDDAEQGGSGVSSAHMKLVLELSRLLAVTTDLDALLQQIAEATVNLLHCERASIWLHDPAAGQLWTKVALGSGEIRVAADAGIVGSAFSKNQVLHVPRPYEDPRFNPANDRRTGFVTHSLLAAPMLDFGAQPVGVIQAVNKLTKEFTDEDLMLIRLLADQAGVAVQRNRLQIAAMANAELKREMDLARKVQEAMLPSRIPPLAGFDIAGWAKPASVTGGDCYDLWPLCDGRLGIFLGDASGHGMAPTLVVSQARTLVRALCDASIGKCDPHDILQLINARLSQDLEPTRFVTAFLGFLSPDGSLQWQSAGHGPILFRESAGAEVRLLEAPVPPLNALPELLDEPPAPLKLNSGGELIVMSDGIFESFSPADKLFGANRVVELLNRCRGTAADYIAELRAELVDWQGKEEPVDDQTIVIVKREGMVIGD